MKITNESKIGMMVTVVVVLLGVITVKTGKMNFSTKSYMLKAQFRNIDGVNLNSPVMFNGYEVGIVEDIAIKEDEGGVQMELQLRVDERARLREGARAYIKNLGFMGEKYVGLTSGEKGGPYVPSGTVILGEEPPDFGRLISSGDEIAERLKSISKNIDERLETNKEVLDETLLNLNSVMKDLASIVANADERLSVNEQKIDDTITNLHGLSVNLEEMSYDLKRNPWKILHRTKSKRAKEPVPEVQGIQESPRRTDGI